MMSAIAQSNLINSLNVPKVEIDKCCTFITCILWSIDVKSNIHINLYNNYKHKVSASRTVRIWEKRETGQWSGVDLSSLGWG